MKKAFTLIELLVVLTILGILYTVAVPTYDNYILKSRFDEAKVTLQALMLAQERYKIENGHYFSLTSGTIDNEKIIANNLKVDLSTSNNFAYRLVGVEDIDDIQQYRFKAILRPRSWVNDCDSYPSDLEKTCKQNETQSADDWVSNYTRGTEKHYMEIRYPTPLPDALNGIDYTHIYTE